MTSTFKASPCADAPLGLPSRGHWEPRWQLFDARGISCGYVCDTCEAWKRAQYRCEIFTNPNYDAPDLGDDESE